MKPANVLVGGGADAGRVYLTDFGISRTRGRRGDVTATGELVGTADFVAPEQIAGDPVDHRADVYALGAVLHFAVTGESPFPRDTELATLFAHSNAPRPRPSEIRAGVPVRLDVVVAKAMAIDPAARFDSAGGLARALEAVLEGEETLALPVGEQAVTDQRQGAEAPPPRLAVARGPRADRRSRRSRSWSSPAEARSRPRARRRRRRRSPSGARPPPSPSGRERVWVAARER